MRFKKLLLIGLVFFLVGCVSPKVEPLLLPVLTLDLQEVDNPPSNEELIIRPQLLLNLIVYKDEFVSAEGEKLVLAKIKQGFAGYGNFEIIPARQVEELLSLEENRSFQPGNAADAISLAKKITADFVAQIEISSRDRPVAPEDKEIKVIIKITVFTTDSGQVIFQQEFNFDSSEQNIFSQEIKELVQTRFPLRGFILETRGEHSVARISLGRSFGIEVGREFVIRERQVKDEIVGGFARRIISFSAPVLASVKVIRVEENDSWIWIEPDDREKIKKGQVVFSSPEDRSFF